MMKSLAHRYIVQMAASCSEMKRGANGVIPAHQAKVRATAQILESFLETRRA